VCKDGVKSFYIGPLGLLVLTLAAFFDVLFLVDDAVLSGLSSDLATQFLHWRGFGFGEIARGNLPLWNPHIYSGAPFLAGFQSALLYPLNVLYLVLPLAKAVNWGIALHAFLGGLFFYLWAFKRGLHPLACFLAGAEFISCAPYFLHIYAGHLPNICTMIWAPLLFLAIDGAVEKPAAGWCLLGSFAVAMQILAGHIQYTYYTGIAASIYLAVRLYGAPGRLKALGCFALFYVGAVILAAAQILPGIEAGRDTLRGMGVPYEFAAMFSFPPENLVTWLVPAFFGDTVHFPYWGRWYLWEMSLFISATGFLLAVYAVVLRQGRERFIPTAMAGILLLLAMGSYLPWFGLLHAYLPGFDKFRGVSKFVFQATLFVILLSAMGLDSLLRDGLRKRWQVLAALGAAAIVSLIIGLSIRQSAGAVPGLWADIMRTIGGTQEVYLPPEFFAKGLAILKAGEFAALGLVILSATCALIAAVLFLRISNLWKCSLLVGLAVIELFSAGRIAHHAFRLDEAYPRDVVAMFTQRTGDHRILNPANPNLAMSMGWRDVWGYDPLIPRRYGEFMAWMQQVDLVQIVRNDLPFRYHPLLRMLGCRYMLTPVEGRVALAELTGDAMPRAALVGQWAVEPERDRAFAILGQPGFNPRRLVVLERAPNLPAATGAANPGTVRVTDTSSDQLTIEADVNSAAVLVVTDNYMDGWRIVPLEGSSSDAYEIIPANYTLRGVPLAPGHHHFRMEYRPASFVIGAWLSLIGAAAWLGLAGVLLRRRRTTCAVEKTPDACREGDSMRIPAGRRRFYACLVLAAATLAVYHPVLGFNFVNLDDQLYVYENPHVRAGITLQGIRWAFTSLGANFWHPLTWLSHMLDWQLFGPNAGGHHATGLLLHVACTLLLFMALSRMTARLWESAAVAALFALHPLHVESVAWVSERKDVLSTFFFMLTLLAYPRYVENRSAGRALLVITPYALGLMAKPMLVTVPFVLLLLDVWPLRRFGETGLQWAAAKPLLLEKIPFVLLALPAGLMAVFAQDRGTALASLELVPLDMRLSSAAVGAVTYLWKTIWPVELAVHYPLGPVHAGIAIGAAMILVLLTALALFATRRYPYVTVGWLWYLLTLAPVSGLVQVGCHSMADRYTYIPLIGIFIIAAWGIPELLSHVRGGRRIIAFTSGVLLLVMAVATMYHLQFWKSSDTLFRRALAVTGPSGIAENNLATALISRGAYEEALPHILRAVELRPTDEEVVFNVGNALAGLRRDDEAKAWFEKTIGMNPRFARAYTNLGALLVRQQKYDEAIRQLEAAQALNPGCSLTRLNLAVALARTGRTKEAAARLEEAVRLAPDSLLLRTKVVQTYWLMGLRDRALGHNDFIRGVDGKLAGEITRWMETKENVH